MRTDLDSTSAFCGALAYVVESCARWLGVAVFAGPTQVDDQWFVLEQTHQMRRLLALRDTDLGRPKSESKAEFSSAAKEHGHDKHFSLLPGWLFDPVNHPEQL